MKIKAMAAACCCVLMSCGSSGNGNDEAFADSGQVGALPAGPGATVVYSGNVESVTYDPDTQILNILGDPFDLAGDFVRAPERDVAGFAAFENERGFRQYLALLRTDDENDLAAGVVGTPVRFNTEFGGTVLARGAVPDLPTNREVRHVGEYAAVRNVGTNVGADMSNSFLHRVTGDVQLDLDFFSDGPTPGIEGAITNRRNLDATVQVDGRTVPVSYGDIVLVFSGIDDEGNFAGIADEVGGGAGSYVGVIAGTDAAASAGIVEIGPERGAFIARTDSP